MLRMIPVRRFDALMSLRSMNRYPVPTCSHRRLFSDSPAAATIAAAAENQRRLWVMLSRHGIRTNESLVADSKTVAEARTSTGQNVRVSLRCAAPPASSKLYYDFPKEKGAKDEDYLKVVAAHGDLLLLEMGHNYIHDDYFVYTPAGPCRPPSLSLLPTRRTPLTTSFILWLRSKFNWMAMSPIVIMMEDNAGYAPYMVQPPTDCTGLLRRGENDVLVVQLRMWFKTPRSRRQLMAEFSVIDQNEDEEYWKDMDPVPILHDFGGNGNDLRKGNYLMMKSPKYPVSVGDQFLCWVHYGSGFMLCDMADEANPKARYVPFPAELSCWNDESDSDNDTASARYMGAAGDRNVRLVSIDPNGVSGFTINTWSMKLDMDEPLAWVKEGEINSEELFALPGYEGLPHLQQENLKGTRMCFDLDNPDIVGLLICNDYTSRDEKVWMIQLNMKTKTLLSAFQAFTNDPRSGFDHLPVQLQYKPDNTG